MEPKISAATNLPVKNINKPKEITKPAQTTVAASKKDTFEKENKKEELNFFQKIGKKLKPYKEKIAIALALLGGLIIGLGRGKSKQKELESEIRDLSKDKEDLKAELSAIKKPADFDSSVSSMKSRLENTTLDYNPAISPLEKKEKSEAVKKEDTDIPSDYEKTTNRSEFTPFTPPKFDLGKDYFVHIPDSKSEETVKESSPFKETQMKTTITEDYADSVQWDRKKIARDLLQNFYDGHGQTLNGVDIKFEKTGILKYKVRITGKSTYSPDKAVLLGESSKRNNSKAAGNYGEGLKMVVLKLLKDGQSDSVKIASGDWAVDWKLEKGDLNDKKVLSYSLSKADNFDGNYIEFETTDTLLLDYIVNSVGNFYYDGNSDFQNPDFENDLFGFKLLPKGKKGGIYIAGQEFEYNGNYKNVDGLTLFIKEKPPTEYNYRKVFDPSRDRISMTNDNIETIAAWISERDKTSKEEIAKILKGFENEWGSNYGGDDTAKSKFLEGIIKGAYRRNFKFNFPENCISDSYLVSNGIRDFYRQANYRICNGNFNTIGMTSIRDLVDNDRKHTPIEPTEKELQKIKILREAIKTLSPVIKDIGFTDSELQPKIYLFDNNESKNEHKTYSNVEGEAIVENWESKGFWLDRTKLNTKDFSGLLTTSLHEITHKFGSDESSSFSYRLTDVMGAVLKVAKDHPEIAMKLKILEEVWNEI